MLNSGGAAWDMREEDLYNREEKTKNSEGAGKTKRGGTLSVSSLKKKNSTKRIEKWWRRDQIRQYNHRRHAP